MSVCLGSLNRAGASLLMQQIMDIFDAIRDLYRGCRVATADTTGGYWFVRNGEIWNHIPGQGEQKDIYLMGFAGRTDFISDELPEHEFVHDIAWAMGHVQAGRCARRKAWEESGNYITKRPVSKATKDEKKVNRIDLYVRDQGGVTIEWKPDGTDLFAKDWGW